MSKKDKFYEMAPQLGFMVDSMLEKAFGEQTPMAVIAHIEDEGFVMTTNLPEEIAWEMLKNFMEYEHADGKEVETFRGDN